MPENSSDSPSGSGDDLAGDALSALDLFIEEHQDRIAERVDALIPLPAWAEPFDERLINAAINGLQGAIRDLIGQSYGGQEGER
jgi:hypothetical protein